MRRKRRHTGQTITTQKQIKLVFHKAFMDLLLCFNTPFTFFTTVDPVSQLHKEMPGGWYGGAGCCCREGSGAIRICQPGLWLAGGVTG